MSGTRVEELVRLEGSNSQDEGWKRQDGGWKCQGGGWKN